MQISHAFSVGFTHFLLATRCHHCHTNAFEPSSVYSVAEHGVCVHCSS